jgi:eukaryotic-like serine/threonine-protein kinase
VTDEVTGQVLSGGHYRLGALLTPAVWSARDQWEGRDVVAVALAPDGSDGALARVARDVRRAGDHPHPGLAPARDVAAGTDRTLWLVHDVPAGVRGLADADAVPARVLLARALVLTGALAAAHAARLVHGRVGADVVLVGDGPDDVRLLGAASGLRPTDRPAAEDDDTRALAGALAAVPLTDAGSDLATRLVVVLDRWSAPGEEPTGGLDARLRRDLRALARTAPAPAPDERPTERATERLALPPGGRPPLVASGAHAVAPPAAARPHRPGSPGRPLAPGGSARPVLHGPRPPVPPPPPRPGPPPSTPPGRPSRSLVLLAAGAVVLLLVGVAVVVATRVTRGTGPAGPQDRVVPGAIGDPRTVDPCALVDPAALGRAAGGGPVRLVPDLGPPAACTVDVPGPGGDLVLVATLEPVATTVTAGEERRVGPLLVRRVPPRPGVCTRAVVTTEGVQVALDAVVPAGSGAGPCPVADAATDGAVAALSRGTPLPRRAVDDPPGALTGIDACGVLTRADLAAVPGLDPARVVPGVAGWSCRWGSGEGGGAVVTVDVTRRRAVAPTEEVADRGATVTPGPGSCTTALVHRALTAPGGGPRVELLEVTVFGGGPAAGLCDGSRTLAAATGPRLPPP